MNKKQMNIHRIGDTALIGEAELYKFVQKALPIKFRMNKSLDETVLKQSGKAELIYHPFWLAKTLVIAERPPFQPKKLPNMIFVDGVSGYRGVFSKVPAMSELEVNKMDVQPLVITNEEEAKKYIQDVQVRQINRSYLLKKPKHEIVEISIGYVPIWKVLVRTPMFHETFYINANTGESEKYMAQRWQSRKDLIS